MKSRKRIIAFAVLLTFLVAAPVVYTMCRYGYSYADSISRIRSFCIGKHKGDFAPGFSEVAFRKIKPGMTAAKVLDMLGEPFGMLSATGHQWSAWYSGGPANYDVREVVFQEPSGFDKTNSYVDFKDRALVVKTIRGYYAEH